jgi:hypothetical protein
MGSEKLLVPEVRAKKIYLQTVLSRFKAEIEAKSLKLIKSYSFLSSSATIVVTAFLVIAIRARTTVLSRIGDRNHTIFRGSFAGIHRFCSQVSHIGNAECGGLFEATSQVS